MIKFVVCQNCKSIWNVGDKWSQCDCGNVRVKLNVAKGFPNSLGIVDFPLEVSVKNKEHFGTVNLNGLTDLVWNAAQFPFGVRQVQLFKNENIFFIKPDFKIKNNLKEIVLKVPFKNIPTDKILYYQRSEGVFCIFSDKENSGEEYPLNGYILNKMYNRKEIYSILDF